MGGVVRSYSAAPLEILLDRIGYPNYCPRNGANGIMYVKACSRSSRGLSACSMGYYFRPVTTYKSASARLRVYT